MPAPTLIRNHKLENIHPTEGKMLVRLHGAKLGLLHVPNPDELEPEGEVLVVGPGYRLPDGISYAPAPVKAGDFVVIGRAPVTPIKVDGNVCYLMTFQSVEAVVDKGEVEKFVKP